MDLGILGEHMDLQSSPYSYQNLYSDAVSTSVPNTPV